MKMRIEIVVKPMVAFKSPFISFNCGINLIANRMAIIKNDTNNAPAPSTKNLVPRLNEVS